MSEVFHAFFPASAQTVCKAHGGGQHRSFLGDFNIGFVLHDCGTPCVRNYIVMLHHGFFAVGVSPIKETTECPRLDTHTGTPCVFVMDTEPFDRITWKPGVMR
jgi:hypothetical protein